MSTLPDNELDLEKLFLPAWAQEPSSAKSYASYEGEERPGRREERRGPRPPRRREANRMPGEHRGPRREGERPKTFGPGRRGFERSQPRERREPPPPPPEINLSLLPDEKGVESLARQIRVTGRAYPLFDIARLILQKPDRYSVAFNIKKDAQGKILQPLFLCALDDTLWLSEDEAVAWVLKTHFATFYQAERTATEPPKGKYTFVAQCGLSGVILGPPNYHDYQNQLRKLHAERFSRMPFEAFKARVKIVKDEAVVQKWIEEQSFKTEYICLNVPEAQRLGSRGAVEKHFRETHRENIIKPIEAHTLTGVAARALRSPGLSQLLRVVWEEQKRFPLQLATALSQQFARHGLQFFKVNRAVTHVSVARPHYLDLETTPVSDGVKRIVEFINAHPRCTRRHLMEALAPAAPTPTAAAPAAPEGQSPTAPTPEPVQPSQEQTIIGADLHWLIHQGHVIEFANGTLETAKKPAPKPQKPEAAKAAEPPTGEAASPVPPEASAAQIASEQPTPDQAPQPPAETPPAAPEAAPASTDLVSVAEDVAAAPPPAPTTESGPANPAGGNP